MSSRKGKEVARGPVEEQDDHAMADYTYASSSAQATAAPATGHQQVRKSKTIKSEGQITLLGPLDVVGSVKSGSNIVFNGDFTVREKIEAYGAIDINGHLACNGKMKAYGTIQVVGHLAANDKVKAFGKFRIVGTCEAQDLEIWGNTTINGFLTCKSLTLYGSLTLIGQNSGYVAEAEKIWGSTIVREDDADW